MLNKKDTEGKSLWIPCCYHGNGISFYHPNKRGNCKLFQRPRTGDQFCRMLGKIQEEHRPESVYSASGSSKHSGNKRKPTQSSSMITSGMSEIRQRVLSARILRFKTVQNQLTMAQQQIHELEQENRGLKTTVRRQEKALDKYDNANAELPRLLKNHQEEIRVWHEKSKVLHKSINDLSVKLKQKDNALLVATDQNKHLQQLNRDR